MLQEYDDMNKANKNLTTSAVYQKLLTIYKTKQCHHIV